MNLKGKFFLRLFNIRENEVRSAGLFFFYHFFLGLGTALVFTTVSTLFLAANPTSLLPTVYMLSALAMLVTGRVYSYLEHHFNIQQFLPAVSLCSVLITLIFRVQFEFVHNVWIPLLMMIGFRLIYLLGNLEFWGLSALVFDVRQSKRLFGFISSGDVPAKLLGYLSVSVLVPIIGLPDLLWIAVVSFIISFVFLKQIFKARNIEVQHTHPANHSKSNTVLKSFFGDDLISTLAVVAFLGTIVFTLVDFSFLSQVQTRYHSEEQLAGFLGIFFSLGYTITLITKLYFAGRLTEQLGVGRSLMLLPLFLIVLVLVFLLAGTSSIIEFKYLAFVGVFYTSMNVIRYAIYDPVSLVMLQPLSSGLRLKGHTVIKGFIQPIAVGLTGIVLYCYQEKIGLPDFYHLSFLILIVLVLMFPAISKSKVSYFHSLNKAINRRFITGADIPIVDDNYFELVEHKLNSGHTQEVVHAMDLLSGEEFTRIIPYLEKLLDNEHPVIVIRALEFISDKKIRDYQPQIMQLVSNNTHIDIRKKALEALDKNDPDACKELTVLLKLKQKESYTLALSGLLSSGLSDWRQPAEQELELLIKSGDKTQQILALNLMTDLVSPQFNPYVTNFLRSNDPDLIAPAIQAAGRIRQRVLITPLMELITNKRWKNPAVEALIKIGKPVIKLLLEKTEANITFQEKITWIRICEMISSYDAEPLLIRIALEQNFHLRTKAFQAMKDLPEPVSEVSQHLFETMLNDEFELLFVLYTVLQHSPKIPELMDAVEFEIKGVTGRIFSLLGLIYDRQLIRRADRAVRQAKGDHKANALELLDSVIPRKTHELLAAIFEPIPGAAKAESFKKYYRRLKANDSLKSLLDLGSNVFSEWTICMTINAINYDERGVKLMSDHVSNAGPLTLQHLKTKFSEIKLKHPHLYKQISDENLQKISKVMHTKDPSQLSDIEKVFVLKSTSLFAGTPENIIAEIVPIVKEKFVGELHPVFKKGDSGSSMFIIYGGEIRIHDGEQTFAVLKKGDFFGELALLDPEPRSASATALTDTLLLELDEEDAYELMEERIEVLKSIIRILCKRIRNQNDLISNKNK